MIDVLIDKKPSAESNLAKAQATRNIEEPKGPTSKDFKIPGNKKEFNSMMKDLTNFGLCLAFYLMMFLFQKDVFVNVLFI